MTNLIRIVLHWSGIGEEGTISWHLGGVPAAPTDASLESVLDSIDTKANNDTNPSAYANVQTVLPSGQTLDYLAAYGYASSAAPASAQALKAISHVGGGSGDGNPLQATVVTTLRTGKPGRSFRGRTYWPNHPYKPDGTTGLIGANGATFFADLAGQWGAIVKEAAQATLSSNNIYWGVFSRARGSINPVTSIAADNRVDIQRRRAASLAPTHTTTIDVNSNP